jgi:hypothetical protein
MKSRRSTFSIMQILPLVVLGYACNEDCYIIAMHKSGGVVTSSSKESVNKGVFINHIFDRLYGGKLEMVCSIGGFHQAHYNQNLTT